MVEQRGNGQAETLLTGGLMTRGSGSARPSVGGTAWVVGPPAGPGGSAEVLRVWPTRRPLGRMTAEAFAALVDGTTTRRR